MKSILIVFMVLFISGCQDLNTTCSKDSNDSNSSDNNISDICSDINESYCANCPTDLNCSDKSKWTNDEFKCFNCCDTNCTTEPIKPPPSYCADINCTDCPPDLNCSDKSNWSDDDFKCFNCCDTNCTVTLGQSASSSTYIDLGSISYSNSNPGLNSDSGTNSDLSLDSDLNSDPGSKSSLNSDSNPDPESDSDKSYIRHTDIKVELFWIGRNDNNYNITSSAWDSNWITHYGGADTPDNRSGYHPASFTPKENPFYAALPYNDLSADGERKYGSDNYIPWTSDDDDPYESICKNRWVEIRANKKTAYAQWEDVGPYDYSTDINYVFGGKKPLNHNDTTGAGIAISPAVRDFLNLDVNTTAVDWVFVEEANVPDGPWKDIITDPPSD